MSLLDTMKRVAVQSGEVSAPAMWMYGEVKALDPLEILVDNRFTISGDAIVVPRELKTGENLTHTHTVPPHDHTVPHHSAVSVGDHSHTISGGNTGGAGGHGHAVNAQQTAKTPLETDSETYIGLAQGETVILLRNHGGQQFLVLGRA